MHTLSARRLAKMAAPALSRMLMTRLTGGAVHAAELASSVVQGKGASQAWDLSAEVRAIAPFIKSKRPAVLLDVGANFGEWSKRAAALIPGYDHLVMVEPQPVCIEALEALPLSRKSLVKKAVSDQPGRATFHTTDDVAGWGASSLFARDDTYFENIKKKEFEVEVTTLDAVIREQSLDRVDFMKMDIEGAEYHALLGARHALESGVIKALSFEFGSSNINSRTFFRDFWSLLTPMGFQFERILPDGRTWTVHKYDEDLEYFRGVTNYIACRV